MSILRLMAAAALMTATSAQAAFTVYTDRASFMAATTSLSFSTEDFESCGTSTAAFTGALGESGLCSGLNPDLDFRTDGVPGAVPSYYVAGPGQSANATTALGINTPREGEGTIRFLGRPATAFGLDYNQNFGGGSQEGYAGFGFSIYSVAASPFFFQFNYADNLANETRFFGITSDQPFDSASFKQFGGFAVIDNVTIGSAVPEPASWAMMIGGLAMVGGALRSRRRTTVRFA